MEEIAAILTVLIIGFLFCLTGGLILGAVLSPFLLVIWIIKKKRNSKAFKIVFQKCDKMHLMQNLTYDQLFMIKKAIMRKHYKIIEVSNA